ncbi:hypothetical protein BJX99DRAFT_256483 [Aspergillus californicus]
MSSPPAKRFCKSGPIDYGNIMDTIAQIVNDPVLYDKPKDLTVRKAEDTKDLFGFELIEKPADCDGYTKDTQTETETRGQGQAKQCRRAICIPSPEHFMTNDGSDLDVPPCDIYEVADEGDLLIVLRNSNDPFAVWEQGQYPKTVHFASDEDPANRPVFKVSSERMLHASAVFEDLFLQRKRAPGNITIRGWDARALHIVLEAIHGGNQIVPHFVSLEMLAKIAVFVELFQCQKSLELYTDFWIKPLKKNIPLISNSRDLLLWLWVTYAFSIDHEWRILAVSVMERSCGPISALKLPFPPKLIGKLNATRESAIQRLIDNVYNKYQWLAVNPRGCSFYCKATMLGVIMLRMIGSNLFILGSSEKPVAPFYNLSYFLLQATWGFVARDLNPPRAQCNCYQKCFTLVERELVDLRDQDISMSPDSD